MITFIFGLPRVGKTALMTHFANELMTVNALERLTLCKQQIKRMNKGGFNYSVPKNHLVYADYTIKSYREGYKRRLNYAVTPFNFGFDNEFVRTAFLPPYSSVFFDEFQKLANCRDYKNMPDWISRFYELHGHNHLDIFISCQRYSLIDLNIRSIVGKFLEVVDLKIKQNNYGEITGLVWTVLEYDNITQVESEKKGKKTGKKVYIKSNVNIFDCYNSFNFMPFFYKGHFNHDFDREISFCAGYDINSIANFNRLNSYEKPVYMRSSKK